jgi:protein-S-isoprenylcysteine O-methyltransferase Ste14
MGYLFDPARLHADPRRAAGLPRRAALAAMLIVLPLFTAYAFVCLTYYDGALVLPELHRFPRPSRAGSVMYGVWLLLQVALYLALPARTRSGTALEDGTRLTYRMNGWLAFWCTCVLIAALAWSGIMPPTIGYDEFGPLLIAANVTAFAIAVSATRKGWPHILAGPQGQPFRLAAFVMGTELNPRIGSFDLKFFCESRPGLILWVALDASCAAKQYALHGTVTTPMLLVNAFQFLYVADYFFHEDAILTTWDIRHERFGWMLCWGCLVWVPFVYSIQAYYLVTHTHELPVLAAAAVVTLNLAGYFIFRTANLQKHRFRNDPNTPVWGHTPEFIRTPNGSLLLTSGWWGVARHLNYLGDWMMAVAWCLPVGFAHPLPWFYVVYFTILLVHRERRDHDMCLSKYGAAWEAYCRKVPWRIVPGIY